MADSGTRAKVTDLYSAYQRRDFERVAALIHDDIDWLIYGPGQVFPFVGLKRGKAAVLAGLLEIAKHYAIDHYDPEIVVVDGDQAAVLINASFVQRSSQRVLRVRLASFQRYRDGRLILFREFFDSYDAVEQAIGRELQL